MNAEIRVRADRRLGAINPHVYGIMFENSGRCNFNGKLFLVEVHRIRVSQEKNANLEINTL